MAVLSNPPQDVTSVAFKSWIYQAWKAIISGSSGGGTVTSVTGVAPVSVSNPTSSAVVSVPLFHASGAGHASGLVPDPGASSGSTHYLREDATWAIPGASTGSVLQVKTHSDGGNTTSSTSYVNLTGTAFSFTPVSTNSTLVIDCQFYMSITQLASANTFVTVQLFDGSTGLGSSVSLEATSASGGIGVTAPGYARVFVANSALTARSITLHGFVGSASSTGEADNQNFTITEIQN
jgi:hypothetical protein